MMQTKTKLIIWVLVLSMLIGGGVFLSKDGSQLTGRLDKQVAFFRTTPEKEIVIENTFVSFKEGSAVLINAALKVGKITQNEAQELRSEYDSSSKMSRSDFAALAVEIFKLESKGQGGPRITDVNPRGRNAQAIYTCVMNGCLDIEFNPENQATWEFVNKVGGNLASRFTR